MVKQSTKIGTPRLRFPEFRGANGWKTMELRQLAEFVTERVGTTECIPYTITSGVGLVSQQEKLGRTIAGKSLKNYVLLQRNDFAYNKSATKAFPQGFIARYTGDERAAVPNSIFTCIRTNDEVIDPVYLDGLFSTNLHGNWLRSRIAVGARAHGSLNVSDEDLMALPVPLPGGPSSFVEQQKIAGCLASLDEVIAAQGRKVKTLKEHKRGLMQQLFPDEGETVPRLRFPEFCNAPEWAEKSLGSQGQFLSSLNGKTAADFDSGQARFIPYSNVFENIFVDVDSLRKVQVGSDEHQNAVRKGDIFFTVSSETQIDAGMSSVLLQDIDNCYLNSFCALFRFHDSCDINSRFAGYVFRSRRVRAYLEANAQGAIRYNISRSVFRDLAFLLPHREEQEEIASFLSCVDSRINAEECRFSHLKSHRQGLVQQLFPASEGG
jgi:type I restriction enzyme S subunit